MKNLLLFFGLMLSFYSCDNSIKPESDSLKLVLSADKTSGVAPITVKFTGAIEGNTEGLTGQIPDYFFFSQTGKTIIPYSIPDTSQNLNTNWSDEVIYHFVGEYKVVLLYQGTKHSKNLNLYSDTLVIKVN